MSSSKNRKSVGAIVVAASLGVVTPSLFAQTKSLPDAQVESNVIRQLATAPELSTQNIQSSTIYGTVTLSGVVQTEELRSKAENLVARADGVKKVVDQLTLGDPSSAAAGDQQASDAGVSQQPNTDSPNCQLQSDGTCAPSNGDGNQVASQAAQPAYNQQAPAYNQQQPYPQPSANQPGYPQQPQYAQQPAYGQQPGYVENGAQPGYGQPVPPPRRPMYNGYAPYPANGGASYGPGNQQGGQIVTVAPGALLQVRVNRGIDSNHIAPGSTFEGTVLNDVVMGGAVAIPRGATVQGTVIDAHKAGALKGRGELALALNGLVLGGQVYPLVSVPWDREGRDKTITTVNSALGLGALGAIIGGVSGGGAGAAIGAAAGGAVGVAGAASSGGGRVIVPPESVLTFHTAQPLTVTTVSQQEMARLAYGAGPAPGARPAPRRYYSPYGYYYGPPPAPYRY